MDRQAQSSTKLPDSNSRGFNPARRNLFAGSGHTFAEIAALGKDSQATAALCAGDFAEAMPQCWRKSGIGESVGKLQGSDPAVGKTNL